MRMLLTGASGVLGSHLVGALAALGELIAAGHSRPARGGVENIRLDITDARQVDELLDSGRFTHFIHPAAVRTPEECVADPARAYLVNAVAVEYIAAACCRNGVKLTYISTDYVFAGDNPPYAEEARPNPINIYGRSKLAGEYAARTVPGHLVARIPILWSEDPDDPKANVKPILDEYRKGKPFAVENVLIRHYSPVGNIAAAIAFCLGHGVTGTVHLSAVESQRKADFARLVGRRYGFDPELVRNGGIPEGTEVRPQDPSLDTTYYQSLGGPRIRGLSEALS